MTAQQQSRLFESSYGQSKMHERLGVPPWLMGQWERGFPTEVSADFTELRDTWPQLAWRLPIRKLRVFEVSESGVAEFATWPALSVLQELDFSASWEVPTPFDVIPILADCEALRGLRMLMLWHADFNDATVSLLLDSPYFAKLNRLLLGINRNTPALSQAVKDQLTSRFGEEVFNDRIPF